MTEKTETTNKTKKTIVLSDKNAADIYGGMVLLEQIPLRKLSTSEIIQFSKVEQIKYYCKNVDHVIRTKQELYFLNKYQYSKFKDLYTAWCRFYDIPYYDFVNNPYSGIIIRQESHLMSNVDNIIIKFKDFDNVVKCKTIYSEPSKHIILIMNETGAIILPLHIYDEMIELYEKWKEANEIKNK